MKPRADVVGQEWGSVALGSVIIDPPAESSERAVGSDDADHERHFHPAPCGLMHDGDSIPDGERGDDGEVRVLSYLADKTELSKRQIGELFEATLTLACKEAKNGFVLPGFGKATVRKSILRYAGVIRTDGTWM